MKPVFQKCLDNNLGTCFLDDSSLMELNGSRDAFSSVPAVISVVFAVVFSESPSGPEARK